ncbi:MAG: hypothetical protein QX196_03825, partial [Methylococcaceae bacterium]
PFLHRNHKRLITIDEYEFIAHGRNLLTGKCKNLFYQICAGEVGQTPSLANHANQVWLFITVHYYRNKKF